jgi:hypothetical protein
MQVRVFSEGDYWVVEVYDDGGRMLIRVGFDHEPSQDEVDTILERDVISSDPSVLESGHREE